MNWAKYAPYFSEQEFKCKHTGKCDMQEVFMDKLLELRKRYNKPMTISSGYRDPMHPAEISKQVKGAHTKGMACDIAIFGGDAIALLKLAIELGFNGIGINQKGTGRFIHLDTVQNSDNFPRPAIWSY